MLARILLVFLAFTAVYGQRRDTPRGKAGEFDFYLLSMSWSPQYCSTPAGERDNLQCNGARRYAFVLHGLWPQYERGWPQYCEGSQGLSNQLVERMLDVMPSRRLVRHEWEKHGVCTGLSAADYFGKARAAFAGVKAPAAMQSPKTARTVAPAKIREEFVAANPGLRPEAVSVTCSGRFLNEVRVCLGKDMKARACPADVTRQACRMAEVIVQPVR